MTDALVKEFLGTYDESRFPADFLQQYELLECLSHNELGETFLVKDRPNGKRYVAKCYSDGAVLSHTPESDLLKRLTHKGLPLYIAEYRNETMRCIVRQYAPGISLDQLVRERPLTRAQVISISVQLCEILAYLHGQTPAVIHRDIKPQNIIIDEQGNVTLIDFGISRIYDETAQEDTVSFGTRFYSPPEQYGFSQTDSRSDIYSLGVLLYWLLTGNTDARRVDKVIPDLWLSRVVERCTAFAPKDRYKNAAQVRDALTGKTLRRWIGSFLVAVAVLLAAILYAANSELFPFLKPAGLSFKEPLIEQAVHLALEKDSPQVLSEQDLLAVTEIYVFGDKASADEAGFKSIVNSFVNNDGTVRRGSIGTLDDLKKLKNLRRLSLGYQTIVDLEPLTGLIYLEQVDLRHNPIKDVSPLSGLPSLSSLTVFDTLVSDMTPLSSCLHLSTLDAGYTQIRSTAALEGLTSVQILMLRKAPLRSLERIDSLPLLEQIYLSETQVMDLSPLLDLPRLQVLEVDESMRKSAEAIEKTSRFKIVYQ